MKRKSVIIALIAVIIILYLLFFAPVDFGVRRQITISAAITDVVKEITDLHNWPHWKTELKGQDTALFEFSATPTNINSFLRFRDNQYTILKDNTASVTIRENTGNANPVYHTLFAIPDSFGTATTIRWIKSVPPIMWIKEKLNSSAGLEADLNNLKTFMETPNLYYGYLIEKRGVIDSLVMTEKIITLKKNQTSAIIKLYRDIIEYASMNNFNVNASSPRMANYYEINKDSVQIMAGIPVDKKAPEKSNISYLEMPSHGKMLVGHYEGDYAGLKKLYHAMDKYLIDKHLHTIASPYEKYLTNPKSSDDSLHMKIELWYPIL